MHAYSQMKNSCRRSCRLLSVLKLDLTAITRALRWRFSGHKSGAVLRACSKSGARTALNNQDRGLDKRQQFKRSISDRCEQDFSRFSSSQEAFPSYPLQNGGTSPVTFSVFEYASNFEQQVTSNRNFVGRRLLAVSSRHVSGRSSAGSRQVKRRQRAFRGSTPPRERLA